MRVRLRNLTATLGGHHLARLSYWSRCRDRACTGQTGRVDGNRGSIDQQPYDFARIIARYAG